jgi:hypothetical protein
MAGIRVQHHTARNARFTIVENDRPYPTPYTCTAPQYGGCGTVHLFKTHHLNLDETGSAIINKVLYEKIKHLLVLNGFTETNVVRKPPAQGIGMRPDLPGTWGNIPIIRGEGS